MLGFVAAERPCRRPDGRPGRRRGRPNPGSRGRRSRDRAEGPDRAATSSRGSIAGPVEARAGLPGPDWAPGHGEFSVPESLDLLDIADRVRGFFGMLAILGVAVFLSDNRRAISRRVVFWGLALQWGFALLVLRVPAGIDCLEQAGKAVESILDCARRAPGSSSARRWSIAKGPAGFVFAFRVLPTVIFVAALFAVLYHLGVMQWIVRGFAVVMAWLMGTSGAESLNVAASLFLGQTEAPLTIRPYLPRLTRSELLTVMTSGMAHVSGGVMAAYIALRHRGPAHLDGRDHDGPRRDPDVEDAGARDREARDAGHRQHGREVDRRQRARRRVARHPRRPAPGARISPPC